MNPFLLKSSLCTQAIEIMLKNFQKIRKMTPLCKQHRAIVLACSAGGFWWGQVDIPIGCSGRHIESGKQLVFLPHPPPPPTFLHRILAPILPVCNESKTALDTRKMKTTKTPTKTACTVGYHYTYG